MSLSMVMSKSIALDKERLCDAVENHNKKAENKIRRSLTCQN